MLELVNFKKNGDVGQEYLLYKVVKDCNLKGYAVADNTYSNGKLSNIYRHVFFFPSCDVKVGEYVSLWSGKGVYKMGKLKQGDPVHRFYWNSGSPIWNDQEEDKVHLLKYIVI